MRRLIWIIVLAAILFSAWWVIAMLGLRNGVDAWLAERRSLGWQAEAQALDMSGYPAQLELSLVDLILADPDRGVAVSFPTIRISTATWAPTTTTLELPSQPMTIATPSQRFDLSSKSARATMRLHPGPSLEMKEMSLTSGEWEIRSPSTDLLAAAGLQMDVRQDAQDPTRYAFGAEAPTFTPGTGLRAAMRLPDNWPLSFETLKLAMNVQFDRPWDLAALEGLRPQPRQIDLQLAEASWGALLLRASGKVDVDETGLSEGSVSLQARNWRDILAIAEETGALPPRLRPQIERALGALAAAGGNPDAIDVTLTLSNGMISLGFIPLARAPRLILR